MEKFSLIGIFAYPPAKNPVWSFVVMFPLAKSSKFVKLSTASPRIPEEEIPAFTPKDGTVCAKLIVEIAIEMRSRSFFFIFNLEPDFKAVFNNEKENSS